MAKKSSSDKTYGARHSLIIYRLLARRFRPAGYLLFISGLLAQLPQFIRELRPRDMFITYNELSMLGIFALIFGAIIVITSIFEERRAYVQCQPEYMLINTAAGRVAVSYKRINAIKSVRIGDIYPWRDYRGRDRRFIKPLSGDLGVEVTLSDFPLPEKVVRKRLHKFLINTRDKGFILIVRRPTDLKLDLDRVMEHARQTALEKSRYTDPIDRARNQKQGIR